MDWSIISIAQVDFYNKTLNDDDLRLVEELLRTNDDVDNLNVHPAALNFYIWGKEKVNYAILDKLRDRLKDMGYTNFEISAIEYETTGKGYHYSSQI